MRILAGKPTGAYARWLPKGVFILKRMNSNDIARLAGVSRSTVSRVINGYANVPEETRRRVMKVIKENHYYPLISGQLLTGKMTKTLGLFWLSRSSIAGDPLTSTYFMHVVDAAARRGYLLLACVLDNITEKQNINFVRKTFMEGRIDGGIFVGTSNNDPLVDELAGLDKMVGLFDYYHENEDVPNKISVNFDRDSGEKTIDYLYGLGHRKIAIVDGDLSRLSCIHRHESYMRGLIKHSLPMQNKWMAYGGIVRESSYPATKKMLEACGSDLPTAICANNDPAAFGVYQACAELGLRIPEDISVVGADGHPNSPYVSPPLTTFSFDFKEMFSSLVNRLIDVIEKKENVPQSEFMEGTLIERSSCRRIDP